MDHRWWLLTVHIGGDAEDLTFGLFVPYLRRIDADSLSLDALRAAQGMAGVMAIYRQVHHQVFPDGKR